MAKVAFSFHEVWQRTFSYDLSILLALLSDILSIEKITKRGREWSRRIVSPHRLTAVIQRMIRRRLLRNPCNLFQSVY
jgi:hypothetical protein